MRKPLYKILLTGIAPMLFMSFGLQAQNCVMNCKDSVIIGLDFNCQALVNSDQLYVNPTDCPGQGIVHIYNNVGKDLGNIVDSQYMDSILNVVVTGFPGTQYTCSSKIMVRDITGPEIACKDTTINCLQYDMLNPKALGFPLIHDNCSWVDSAFYTDLIYNFICNGKGFTGYFGDNWQIDTSCAGDGKFLLSTQIATLIGAGNTKNPSNGNCITSMSIKIPVAGKISFNWLLKGDADKDTEGIICKINNVDWKLSSKDTINGTFISPDLFNGDEFSLALYSNGDSIFNTAVISEFVFSTKITELINRSWKAVDSKGNKSSCNQKISIESIDLSMISFPPDYDGISNNKIACGSDYSVKATGQPRYGKPWTANLNKFNLLKSNLCVNVSYSDKKDSICGGSFKITRTWTISDKCKSDSILHDQLIIIEDSQAPVINAPKELIYYTDADKCTGTVTIPAVIAVDQCSPNNIQLSLTSSFGTSGYGPFTNIQIGEYYVFYTAKDECGNSSQSSSKITVKDNSPPVAITKANLFYYLPLSGLLKIYAKDFDNGSTDNCCIQGFKIKRINDPQSFFKEDLLLNCSDCSTNPVALTFRVLDCYGNYKDITTYLILKDNIAPLTTCPKDITISCSQDITNLNQYGKISYIDNCQDLIQYSENKNLSKCGEGLITRYWTVVDKSSNSAACSQRITVVHNQYWNQAGTEITWPNDYSTNHCMNLADLNPGSLAVGFKQPILTGNTSCSNISVDYTDKLISNNSSGCISIERNWTIIEYCLYDVTQGKEGTWTHKQMLSINEKQSPILTVPNDITVQTQFGECFAFVSLAKATAIDCDPDPIITNSINGTGADISGKYDIGVNLVSIKANDHCGNVSTALVKITVKDAQLPVALCKQNVSIDLAGVTNGGYKTITSDLINNSSYDNCTPLNQLNLSVSPDKITCADIGTKTVSLEIKDKSNNVNTCSSQISITDITGACAAPNYKISGIIKTENNKTVSKVNCNISGGLSSQKTSGNDGQYLFDQLNKNVNYTIVPKKNLSYLNGVTTYDLILLNDHILGKKMLDSPYKFIAADVNNNKKVTLADYLIIKDLILLNINEFPKSDSWRFIPSSFQFPVYHPVLPAFPEKLEYVNLQNNVNDANFIAVKMGDLNNSGNPANKINPSNRSTEQMEISISDNNVNKDDPFCIPVYAKSLKSIKGFQFSLVFNSDLAHNLEVEMPFNGIVKNTDIGNHITTAKELLISWINGLESEKNLNDTLFNICGLANTNFKLSDLIHLGTENMSPEVYNTDYETSAVLLNWTKQNNHNNLISIGAGPNPFKDFISLKIVANEPEEILINLYNIQGQLLKSEHESIKMGNQNLIFNIQDKLKSGMYILNILTKDIVISKKMLMFVQ